MSLSGKITTISCRIDLRAIEPVSNSLIFRPLYQMVVRFMLRKDSISSFMLLPKKKKASQSPIVSDSEV